MKQKRQKSAGRKDMKYRYEVPHLRKCEKCPKLFLWEHDLKLFNANLHYTCPKCRAKEKKR